MKGHVKSERAQLLKGLNLRHCAGKEKEKTDENKRRFKELIYHF